MSHEKEVTQHECAKCHALFDGTGKAGRPHKLCPKCRKK